mgnify:CR=1 FL=1
MAETADRDAGRDRLAALVAPGARDLRRAGLLSVAAALIWLPQAAIVALAIAALLDPALPQLPPLVLAAGFAGLGLARAWLAALSEARASHAADRVLGLERQRLIEDEALRGPLDPNRPASAEVTALAAQKLEALRPFLTRYQPARMRVAVLPPAILALSFWFSWAVGSVLLVAGPLIPVFMALVGLAAREASARQMEEIGSLNGLLMERLSALVDIRVLDAGARTLARFDRAADELRRQTMEVLRIAFLSSTVLELFAALGVAMVAVYVGFALLGEIGFGTWGAPLGVGAGIFLLLMAPDFFQPLRDLAAAWHDKSAAVAVASELAAAEAAGRRNIAGQGAAAAPLAGPARIATRGVAFETAVGHRLLFPDLDLPPGSRVALTGPSGAGKSTLLALLAGLAAPASGRIEVAGQPLGADTADAWRTRIGWVSQTPHFLNRSLADNLALAGGNAATVEQALDLAQARAVVSALPRGRATRLGETGAGVSGGEARRLTIARAAAASPGVILADEPTADLDPETARLVTDGLMRLADGGATLIVATHDPDLVARMDRQIALGDPA